MDVEILVFDGAAELDALGPHEVFGQAAIFGGDVAHSVVTLEPRERVTARHGLKIEPDGTLSASPDIVVVPGGGWNNRSDVGAWAEAERGDIPRALADRHEAGSTVAGVCTGGMLMARGGLIEGRPAVTHHGALSDLEETGAEVVESRVVDDGDIITAGGVTAGLDLALDVVERELGADLAARIAEAIEYERRS